MTLSPEQSRMVEENRGLVSFVLQRSRGLLMRGKDLGFTRDDLFQYGIEGLCTAVATYVPGRGSFVPHALTWIRGAIGRSIGNEGRLVRVPIGALRDVPSKAPSISLAESRALREEIREAARRAQRPAAYWDDPAGPDDDDGEGVALAEVTADPKAATEDDLIAALDRRDRNAELRRALAEVLTPQEQQVLSRRFGLGLEGGEPEKMADTCRALGINPRAVCRIEAAALSKLRSQPDLLQRLARMRYGSEPTHQEPRGATQQVSDAPSPVRRPRRAA